MSGQHQIVIEDRPREQALRATLLLLADPDQPPVPTIELDSRLSGGRVRSLDCDRPY